MLVGRADVVEDQKMLDGALVVSMPMGRRFEAVASIDPLTVTVVLSDDSVMLVMATLAAGRPSSACVRAVTRPAIRVGSRRTLMNVWEVRYSDAALIEPVKVRT